MKILSIGDSFSRESLVYLHDLASQNGMDFYVANLYSPFVSPRDLSKSMTMGRSNYEWEIQGKSTGQCIGIAEALKRDTWNAVILQQANYLDAYTSAAYYPWFDRVYSWIKYACPSVKIYLHCTWAYTFDNLYHGVSKDRQAMILKAEANRNAVIQAWNLPVIPTGNMLEHLRLILDEKNLFQDTVHLSRDYGCLAAAATWFKTLTGRKIAIQPFRDLSSEITDILYTEINNFEGYKRT